MVLELHKLYPDAPIYTSVYTPATMPMFEDADVRTTWLNKFPKKNKHQLWSLIRPKAFRDLDLSEYDLVIASCTAESKQVRVSPGAELIIYCNTPIRYYWSHYHEYIASPGLGLLNPLVRYILPLLIGPLRHSDKKAAQKAGHFMANSHEVKKRIKKYYDRESAVVNPPVDVDRFRPDKFKNKRSGFIITSRQVPYKRIDLAILACNQLKLPLTVIGSGSEHQSLKRIAGETIKFVVDPDDQEIVKYYHDAEAFIFPAEEDFGIVPVEAMAAGLPVIAFSKGGSQDYVVDGETGIFFHEQSVAALVAAIRKYQKTDFKPQKISNFAEKFSPDRFKLEVKEFVAEALNSRQ